jgi:hypothetical protein
MELLAIGSTVGGTLLSNQQNKKSMKRYNEEVTRQNKLLSDQHADRQAKINAARDQQGKIFGDVVSAQDAELKNQQKLSKEKQRIFEETTQKPVIAANASPEFEQAVGNRERIFNSIQPTADYSTPAATGSTENRVLRQAAEKAKSEQTEKAMGVVGAQNKLSAMQDVDQSRTQLFRDLDRGLTDKATEAQAGQGILQNKLRLPEYRMGAQSAVMGENANMPYFRGQEPIFKRPNTTAADILSGLGTLGSMYSFYQPKAGA